MEAEELSREEKLSKEMQELKRNNERKFIDDLKEKLNSYESVKGYMILAKEGVPKETNFKSIENETLAIMAATLYAAANTANSELRKKPADYIKIEYENEVTVIFQVSDDFLLCLNSDKENLEKVIADVKAVSKPQ